MKAFVYRKSDNKRVAVIENVISVKIEVSCGKDYIVLDTEGMQHGYDVRLFKTSIFQN